MTKNRPSKKKIVKAQENFIRRIWAIDQFDDILFFEKICWGCERDNTRLDRAHINSRQNGGSNHPKNFFILCKRCHREQPDGVSKESQIDWLINRELYTERLFRLSIDTFNLLAEEIRYRGDFDIISGKYLESIGGSEGVTRIMKNIAHNSSGLTNYESNFKHGLRDHFKSWYNAHRHQIDNTNFL